MLTMVLLFVVGQTRIPPGPIDAFRANYAALGVDLEFVRESGEMSSSSILNGGVWTGKDLNFVDNPSALIKGRWSCDGQVEYYYCGSPEDVIKASQKPYESIKGAYGTFAYNPIIEGLFDGEVSAEHFVDEFKNQDITVWIDGGTERSLRGKGPFFWWDHPFPYILKVRFPGVAPRLGKAVIAGVPTAIEYYVRESNTGWLCLEVAYDPQQGHLPRRLRMISASPDGNTFVRETYILDSKMTSLGGFVPTEWRDAAFKVKFFKADLSSYSASDVLVPEFSTVGAAHFKATSFQDRTKPVSLSHLRGVRRIIAGGGSTPLGRSTSTLSLSDVRRLLGRKLVEPMERPMLDAVELEEFQYNDGPGWSTIGLIVAAGAGFVVLGLLAIRKQIVRRSLVLLFTAGLAFQSGCGANEPPVLRLSAVFSEPTMLYDGWRETLPLTLVVRNDGNHAARIYRADGGCSCRRVEQSALPRTLKPREQLELPVTYSLGRGSQPLSATFTFETDHGNLAVAARLFPMPRHMIMPESLSHLGVGQDDSWEFDLTHRAVVRDGEQVDSAVLEAPREFTIRKKGTRKGRVVGAKGYNYVETDYGLTLVDREMGLHKAVVTLNSRDRAALAEASYVWKRIPFLSTIPERISLGPRATRVFLRCPDEDVEFAKILRAPEGVRALVSSVRELTVTLEADAPRLIDGFIEVSTSAVDSPPLRVPVVRYASPDAGAASAATSTTTR